MDDINAILTEQIGGILARHVEPIFKAGTRLTLIARTPGNDEADVLVTSDDLDGIAALIERSRGRMEIAQAKESK